VRPSSVWTLTALIFRRQRREHLVFQSLLQTVPGLEERLVEGEEDNAVRIAELVSAPGSAWLENFTACLKIQKGVSSARSDDTKSLKSAILEWIVPRGQSLNPPPLS